MSAPGTLPRLGIGMVGYAFMGVAHSQAWRNAPASSKSRYPRPGRRGGPERRRRARRPTASAGATPRPTGSSSRATTSTWVIDVRRTPGDTHAEIAVRSRRRRPSCCCREAAQEHRRGGRGDGQTAPARHRPGRWPWSASPRRVPASGTTQHTRRRGRIQDRPARARAVPAGLDRRPAGTAVVASTSRRQGPARSGTSARTSSTSRSSSPASTSPGCRAAGDAVRPGRARGRVQRAVGQR